MSELLSTFLTPEVKATLVIILIVIIVLYIMSILWVVRDAYLRGVSPAVWGIIAVIPFLGAMAYAMLRPPLYASDQEEQNIGLLLQQRQLMSFGECPQCGYPTERDYIICPNCHTYLKKKCRACGMTLEPEWTVCPYCATRMSGTPVQEKKRIRRGAQEQPKSRPAAAASKPESQPRQGNRRQAGEGQGRQAAHRHAQKKPAKAAAQTASQSAVQSTGQSVAQRRAASAKSDVITDDLVPSADTSGNA